MASRFERLSIRTQIVLLVLAILVPVGAVLAWQLALELKHARVAADAKVTILADHAAAEVTDLLRRSETALARLAEQPRVRSLDTDRCDPLISEALRLDPEFSRLSLRNRHGRLVCSFVPEATAQLGPKDLLWFDAALQQDGLFASNATLDLQTARWVTVLTHPVRDTAGTAIGLLTLPVDLLSLNAHLLGSTPSNAVVTLIDRERAILLRSAEPENYIGTRPKPGDADPAGGRRDGLVSAPARDGVASLFAFRTLATAGWRVAARLPEAEVFSDYRAARRNIVGIGLGLALLALGLGWHLSAVIVRPVAGLAGAAARVASGHTAARAGLDGPVEIASVAREFNRMLDARDTSEAARRASETRYRTLVDWLPEALSIHVDGTVRFVNKACVELLGAGSADDLVGKASLDFIRPELREATLANVTDAVARSSEIFRAEQVFVRLDGGTVEVEVHGMPIDYDGQPALLASMRDITARKQTELALATSEAQLRGMFESANVAILTVDETQTIVKANAAAADTFHCSVAELIGAPLDRLIPPRYRGTHRHDLRAFGESGAPSRHMGSRQGVTGVRANGEEFPIDAAISHLKVGNQRLYTVFLRDTTERHQAEIALRESEASLRRLLVMLPEAVIVDIGDRIAFANEAAQRLFGAEESALLGRATIGFLHADSVEQVGGRTQALREGASVTPLTELKIVRADGAIRTVEMTATLVEHQAEGSIVMVMRDVTELAETREALADSHTDLQRLVAVQDRVQEDERKRIARELHDDLQQTLAAIRIDLVAIGQRLATAPQTVAPLLAETGDLAAAAIDSTRRIINDLRPRMLEDLGLVPALEALVTQFGRRTGIDCRLGVQDDSVQDLPLPPTIATCLYRVTQEALGNAARHSQASKVRVRYAGTGDGGVVLRISDNGRGMLTGQRRKPDSFGLLGMHERVRALSAILRIDSLPGSGTMIEVIVPASVCAPGPGAAAALDDAAIDRLDLPGAAGQSHLFAGVIDALDGNVAVLDRRGVIVLVNRAWREFAEHHGAPDMRACGPGTNYLEVCRRSAATDATARRALEGLSAVLEGKQPAFALEYTCGVSGERTWFRMRAAPVDDRRILVTHILLASPDDPTRAAGSRAEADTAGAGAA